ncbi:MAG: glutamate-1-semialdehyde 2,1-aminomutase [Candidatus Yanofskybacteria bacterium]|nr:glutamate-1-semialdehyde 2,1-aminomutase [Candidatus Yanofskybacteria bacterium]
MYKFSNLIKKRHDLIPGGAHTYSKGDDQFPANAPKVILRGKGAYVWGNDGKKYLDWCMGLRSVSLGHCYSVINKAVASQMQDGTNFGRPHISEFQLADLLIKTLPNAQMVKFAKNGSTVTTAAVKLARAYTGRKYAAFCKDHPFFSYDDWFIGTTVCDSGVPEEIKNLSFAFKYNDIKSLAVLFKKYPRQIACVIMEVVTTASPKNNFLKKVQALCKKNGAVFIVDEMITGFRWGIKGAQDYYGLKPDLSTYGKGIANGYSVAVLAGRRDIMNLGGLYHKRPRVFLISTTHGAETTGLAAAIAAIGEMKKKHVTDHFWKTGRALKDGLEKLIKKHDLQKYVEVLGFAPNLSMSFKESNGNASPVLRTIFLQEVAKRNILFQGYFAISYSHQRQEINKTLKAFDQVMIIYKKVLESGNFEKYLLGPALKPVFRKYN